MTSTITTIPNAVRSGFPSINNDIKCRNGQTFSIDPRKWTIIQVGKFIGHLINDTIAQEFLKSEVDEKALLLLTKYDLFYYMKIKLGSSIIILDEIKKLRK